MVYTTGIRWIAADAERTMRSIDRNRGSRNGNAALTEVQVRVIKKMLRESDASYREIGKMYLVSSETIRRIAMGDTWNWVTEELELPEEGPLPPSTKTAEDAARSLSIVMKMQEDLQKERAADKLLDELLDKPKKGVPDAGY